MPSGISNSLVSGAVCREDAEIPKPASAEPPLPERIKLEYKRLAGEAVSAAKKDVDDIVSFRNSTVSLLERTGLSGRRELIVGFVGREVHPRRQRHAQSGAVSETDTKSD